MDTVGAESYCREGDAQTLEVENKCQVFNTKVRENSLITFVGYKTFLGLFFPSILLKVFIIMFMPHLIFK